MEAVIQALVLGLVQGLTEFLPISSSGHLVLVPWLLGWQPPTLAFDVALHLGTLVAVLVYFRRDWARLALAFLQGLQQRRFAGHPDRIVAWLIIVGTVPGAGIGFLGKSLVERLTEQPVAVAAFLLITGVILLLTSRHSQGYRSAEQLTLSDAVVIGFAQAFAILPGVSRSGSTIAMGLLRGLAPPEAARFSFLLAIPIIIGAGAREIPELARGDTGGMSLAIVALGVVAAAVSGLLAIHSLLKLLATRNLKPFALYCSAVGLAMLAVAAAR